MPLIHSSETLDIADEVAESIESDLEISEEQEKVLDEFVYRMNERIKTNGGGE